MSVPTFGGICLIKKDGRRSEMLELVERRYTIGRSEHCDIRINLMSASREHAEVFINDNEEVADLT